jgi:hypothetical protein
MGPLATRSFRPCQFSLLAPVFSSPTPITEASPSSVPAPRGLDQNRPSDGIWRPPKIERDAVGQQIQGKSNIAAPGKLTANFLVRGPFVQLSDRGHRAACGILRSRWWSGDATTQPVATDPELKIGEPIIGTGGATPCSLLSCTLSAKESCLPKH